jgi:hypothetical protein
VWQGGRVVVGEEKPLYVPIVAFPGVRVAGMLDFLFFMTHLGMSMIGVTR